MDKKKLWIKMCEYKILFGRPYDELKTLEFVQFGRYLNDNVCKVYDDAIINNELWDKLSINYNYRKIVHDMVKPELRKYYPTEYRILEEYYFGYSPILSYCEAFLVDYIMIEEDYSLYLRFIKNIEMALEREKERAKL